MLPCQHVSCLHRSKPTGESGIMYNPDSKKKGTLCKHINEAECDNLIIQFDIYSIENTTLTIYLLLYLIVFCKYMLILNLMPNWESWNCKNSSSRQILHILKLVYTKHKHKNKDTSCCRHCVDSYESFSGRKHNCNMH